MVFVYQNGTFVTKLSRLSKCFDSASLFKYFRQMKYLKNLDLKSIKGLMSLFVVLCLLLFVALYLIYIANIGDLEAIITLTLVFSSIGTVGFLVIDRFTQKRRVERLKEASLIAEVDTLKTQINPHFFFNTLNNLYSLTITKSKKAPEMVLKLSDIMRYTIYEGAKDRVTLREEITYLENFIDLQKIRFQRELDIKFDQIIEDLNIEVPPLLFIILLENAFKHGAELLTENAFIHMKLYSNNEKIQLEIQNNCDIIKVPSNGGIGLKNLKRRLELIYPKKHTLDLDETIHGLFNVKLEINIL